MADFLRILAQHANVRGSRSTALQPLLWLVGLLLLSTVSSAYWLINHWLTVSLAIATGAAILGLFGAYGYLLFKDRDSLRSERYTLTKMAIERGLVGDNLMGTFESIEQAQVGPKLLEGGTARTVDDE